MGSGFGSGEVAREPSQDPGAPQGHGVPEPERVGAGAEASSLPAPGAPAAKPLGPDVAVVTPIMVAPGTQNLAEPALNVP